MIATWSVYWRSLKSRISSPMSLVFTKTSRILLHGAARSRSNCHSQALIASLIVPHFSPKRPRKSKIGHIVCGLLLVGKPWLCSDALTSRVPLAESGRYQFRLLPCLSRLWILPCSLATGIKQGLNFGLIISYGVRSGEPILGHSVLEWSCTPRGEFSPNSRLQMSILQMEKAGQPTKLK